MNVIRGEVSLKAGDHDYVLVLDINALCALEGHREQKLSDIIEEYEAGTSVTLIRALLWAGLQEHHKVTLEAAGNIITAAGIPHVKAALEKALLAAMPEPTENP